ncbi:MAG TPA: 1-deoxy-D-xylulose-5-phosphate reductoisomerase [Clostridiales bacterium]|nr:1-deoxy-D-xylulose-5-phosphate reductoisomerase [Clostridiales bacterium]
MIKRISVLGSTGSIGVQTLDVVRNLNSRSTNNKSAVYGNLDNRNMNDRSLENGKHNIEVIGMAAGTNIDLLESQAREFQPEVVSVKDEKLADELRTRLKGTGIDVCYGMEGLKRVSTLKNADLVLNSVVGVTGLLPTLEAIRHGKNIALANKETLVAAGEIVMEEAKKYKVDIIPVDSEHSAIFQCIMGNRKKDISRLILTASGGPFRGRKAEELAKVKPEEALKHPNWNMGAKITIDSATMMNKGLEVIEAKWLFNINPDKIQVLVHPQSIIHSMVEYIDGAVIAQLGKADMRIPIQFALTYPERRDNNFSKLDFLKYRELTFEEPDYINFPCLGLAFKAISASGTMPAVMNAANEVAVKLFLDGKIEFKCIPYIINKAMDNHKVNKNPSIDDIIEVDEWARAEARAYLL